jgi:hypothetical protein
VIYNLKNTVRKGKPVRVFIDQIEVFEIFYLDRRRRVYRAYDVIETSVINPYAILYRTDGNKLAVKEYTYGHRQKVEIIPA